MARRVARLLLILCAAVDAGNWELPAEVEAEVGTAYQDDFLKACDGGDEKVVKKLLRTQKDSIDLAGARDKFGQSALTLARTRRHEEWRGRVVLVVCGHGRYRNAKV